MRKEPSERNCFGPLIHLENVVRVGGFTLISESVFSEAGAHERCEGAGCAAGSLAPPRFLSPSGRSVPRLSPCPSAPPPKSPSLAAETALAAPFALPFPARWLAAACPRVPALPFVFRVDGGLTEQPQPFRGSLRNLCEVWAAVDRWQTPPEDSAGSAGRRWGDGIYYLVQELCFRFVNSDFVCVHLVCAYVVVLVGMRMC